MIKRTLAKVMALTMAILMMASTAAFAATEVIVCIQSEAGGAANTGFQEEAGKWLGSTNSELGIHYVNPETGKSLARYGDGSTDGGDAATVTANLPEAGKYHVYYFVSGHTSGSGNDSSALTVTINHKGGSDEVKVDLTKAADKGFKDLGEFEFDAGPVTVNLKSEAGKGFLRFSAMKFENASGTAGTIINGGGAPTTAPSTAPSTTPSTAPTTAPTLAPTPVPTENPAKDKFTDLQGHWAKDMIEDLAGMGIVEGTSETTYEPEGDVTRAEFAALMVRAMGYEAIPYEGQFSDVSADDWFAEDVASMANTEIIVGYEGMFNPNDNITHEEAVKICVAAYELKFGPMDPGALATIFDDYFEISDWAKPYINKGVMISVAQGFDNPLEFKPLERTTRAEAAVMIYHLKNAVEVSERFETTE